VPTFETSSGVILAVTAPARGGKDGYPLPRLAMIAGSTGGWWETADAEPDLINR